MKVARFHFPRATRRQPLRAASKRAYGLHLPTTQITAADNYAGNVASRAGAMELTTLLGFTVLPQAQYFGVLPTGTLFKRPGHKFYLQLLKPPEQAAVLAWQGKLTRGRFGAPDITVLVAQLSERGVNFVDSNSVHTSDTRPVTYLGGTSFEFVKSNLGAGK